MHTEGSRPAFSMVTANVYFFKTMTFANIQLHREVLCWEKVKLMGREYLIHFTLGM